MAVELVTSDDFEEMFRHFRKTIYDPKKLDVVAASIMEKCEKLFAKDYTFSIVDNTNGDLCNSYPSRIVYLEREKSYSFEESKKPDEENNNINDDAANFREHAHKSRIARCRTRFPVPVILLDGKFICRSATISCGKELYPRLPFSSWLKYVYGNCRSLRVSADNAAFGRPFDSVCVRSPALMLPYVLPISSPEEVEIGKHTLRVEQLVVKSEYLIDTTAVDMYRCFDGRLLYRVDIGTTDAPDKENNAVDAPDKENNAVDAPDKENDVDDYEEVSDLSAVNPVEIEDLSDEVESSVGEYRNYDAQLLKELAITNICDLMMEHRKVKLMVNFSSSENADRNKRYRDFTILSMPYPGCEFFQKLRYFDLFTEQMMFDWTQSYITKKVELPSDCISSLGIDWTKYKEWNLDTLTQNYMKVLLKCIVEGTSSMLIHCISGWDRTPLFISLLRMSLWADGKIHRSLSKVEILYLTIGYDWFLFGHQLSSRLSKREEILLYCFVFLKYLGAEEFSVFNIEEWSNGENRPDSSVETDENLIFTAESNHNSSNGDVAVMTDWTSDQTESPNRKSHSSPSEKRESFGFVDNLQDLAMMRSSTPPYTTQNREDEQSLSTPVFDVKSTGPLEVPSSSRQRTESSSSDISYHVISGTGSIPRSAVSSPHERNQGLKSINENSKEISKESSREEKLNSLRDKFCKVYHSAVNFRFKSGSDTGIMGYLNQFSEKVGIRTPKAPS